MTILYHFLKILDTIDNKEAATKGV
jgi:hypothetical protein